MARKINVKLILELRDAGLSRSTIASTRHISRHSVSEVFNIADKKGIRYDDVRALEEPEVYRLFYPEKFANETMYGDPDYEHVHQELKRVGVTLKPLSVAISACVNTLAVLRYGPYATTLRPALCLIRRKVRSS